MDENKMRALQVRVEAKTAQRFSALAAAMGTTEAALLRKAVENLLTDAEGQMDVLREKLRAQYEQEMVELEQLHSDTDHPQRNG